MFDGRLWIVTHRQKTNTKVMVPLLQPALKILKKYEGQYTDGQLMPIITNQKLNTLTAEEKAEIRRKKEEAAGIIEDSQEELFGGWI